MGYAELALIQFQITLVFLKDEVFDLLPVTIGSSVGGLLSLAFVILLLWKAGSINAHTTNQKSFC